MEKDLLGKHETTRRFSLSWETHRIEDTSKRKGTPEFYSKPSVLVAQRKRCVHNKPSLIFLCHVVLVAVTEHQKGNEKMVLEFVVAILSIIVDYSFASIGRQIVMYYVFNYKSNMEKLKKQLTKLTELKEMVQHSVDDAIRKGEEIESAVQTWLNNVEKVTEDARKIIIKVRERTAFKGLCPDLKSRHQLSKKVAKEAKNAGDELQLKGRFGRVSYRAPPQGMGITSVEGAEAFESRNHTLDGVMEALKDANVHMVGVSGMGGVGKTTLVKVLPKKPRKRICLTWWLWLRYRSAEPRY